MKRRGKIALVLIGATVLCLGTIGTAAMAAKKKKSTTVVFFTGSPKFNKGGQVTAKGTLNTVSACKPSRSVKLQVLNSSAVVIATIDGSTTDSGGNWKLSGHLPKSLPAGTNSVRVKANKRALKKFVCKAGVSPSVTIPA